MKWDAFDDIRTPAAWLDQAKELIETPCRRRQTWSPRAKGALIAACLCVAVVGTVVAAERGLLVQIVRGDDSLSQYLGYDVAGRYEVMTSERIPAESFSTAAREAAAGEAASPSPGYAFSSWEDAEAFLGLNLMDNPMLDSGDLKTTVMSMEQEFVSGRCIVRLWSEPETEELYYVAVNGTFDTELADVEVLATITTENAPDGISMGYLLAFDETELAEAEPQAYVTASGTEAIILQDTNEQRTYVAYLTVDHVLFQLNIDSVYIGDDAALTKLKDILDHFS